MKRNRIVIDTIEFEKFGEKKTLSLHGDFVDGTPMYFVEWSGERIIGNPLFNSAEVLFRNIRQVLYDVYGWSYCEECDGMKQGTAKFKVVYLNEHVRVYDLCPEHYGEYCEMRMMEQTEISIITKIEHDIEVVLDE